jgi:hypothetical protein
MQLLPPSKYYASRISVQTFKQGQNYSYEPGQATSVSLFYMVIALRVWWTNHMGPNQSCLSVVSIRFMYRHKVWLILHCHYKMVTQNIYIACKMMAESCPISFTLFIMLTIQHSYLRALSVLYGWLSCYGEFCLSGFSFSSVSGCSV